MSPYTGVPPIPEHLAEQFGGCTCRGMLDLYIGYDERLIAETSWDYTTFQTPFGALRLVTLPMGWTNSIPIFHDNVTFILQAEIPHCKGTLVLFLTSPILSHSSPVHMYSPPSPLYYPQGLYPEPTTPRPDGPTTSHVPTRSYLNSIGRTYDALGRVRVMPRHPPPSRGQPYLGGLVLGDLVLHSFVYYCRLI
jgi:hypothetical protein